MAHKKTMLALLTDENADEEIPAGLSEKRFKEHVPWTRLMKPGKTLYGENQVELLEYVRNHRETLALKPDDDSIAIYPIYLGREMSQADWESRNAAGAARALMWFKKACRAQPVWSFHCSAMAIWSSEK